MLLLSKISVLGGQPEDLTFAKGMLYFHILPADGNRRVLFGYHQARIARRGRQHSRKEAGTRWKGP